MFKRATAVLIALYVLSGCNTTGDGISDEALAGDPAAMLADGSRLNTRGAELVAKGESRLAEGRQQVRDGERQIEAGTASVAAARSEYRQNAGRGGQANSPKGVESEAKELRAIGNRWEDAIEEIRKGNALVDKGNKNIDRGQSEIREGRLMMERGSALVRNSERIRLGDTLLEVPPVDP